MSKESKKVSFLWLISEYPRKIINISFLKKKGKIVLAGVI